MRSRCLSGYSPYASSRVRSRARDSERSSGCGPHPRQPGQPQGCWEAFCGTLPGLCQVPKKDKLLALKDLNRQYFSGQKPDLLPAKAVILPSQACYTAVPGSTTAYPRPGHTRPLLFRLTLPLPEEVQAWSGVTP
jgi:hypothetical protein